VRRLAQCDAHPSLPKLDGDRRVADRELRRQRGDDRGGNLAQRSPWDVRAAMLLRESVSDVVFRRRPPLDEQRAEPATGERLYGESAIYALLRHGAGAYEEHAESGHFAQIMAYRGRKRAIRLRAGAAFRGET